MFNNNVEPLENLIDQFAQFPGIGRKSAVRMAYQVMSMPPKQAMELAKAIEHAKSDLHRCRIPEAGPQHHLRGRGPARHQID